MKLLQRKLKNCPLGENEILPLLKHIAAEGHIDSDGSLIVGFNQGLPEHKAAEHFSLLREYLRGLKKKDPLYEVIDIEEIDPRTMMHKDVTDTGFKIETFGAFGSGVHETTGGCMELIGRYCELNGTGLESVRALDIGTGTGILSVFSFRNGIRNITAVDISLRAVIAALHNFKLNDMTDFVHLCQGSIGNVYGEFDLVIANIFLSAITDIFDDIVAKTAFGGTIILSGIKESREEDLHALIGNYRSLRIKKKLVREEWLCLSLIKK